MAEIILSDGTIALVDDEDFEQVNKYKWWPNSRGYPRSGLGTHGYKTFMPHYVLKLHNIIVPGGYEIDHEDRNQLNNCKSNLRFATSNQNACNRTAQANNKAGYKGVHWDTERNKWLSQICYARHQMHIGRFNTIIEAALMYDIYACQHHKNFACINFPENRKLIELMIEEGCYSSMDMLHVLQAKNDY